MNGQCSGVACEVAATCRRFNPRQTSEALCEFGGNPEGHAVHWAPKGEHRAPARFGENAA